MFLEIISINGLIKGCLGIPGQLHIYSVLVLHKTILLQVNQEVLEVSSDEDDFSVFFSLKYKIPLVILKTKYTTQ